MRMRMRQGMCGVGEMRAAAEGVPSGRAIRVYVCVCACGVFWGEGGGMEGTRGANRLC